MGNSGDIIYVAGKTKAEQRSLQRQCQSGELIRLAKGSYMRRERFAALEYQDRCLAKIVATATATKRTVLAGRAAAHLLGLPLTDARIQLEDPVEVCGLNGSGQRSQHIKYHRLADATFQRTVRVHTAFGTVTATDVPTTCVDLARWHSVENGLVALEYCLNNARQADLDRSRGQQPRPAIKLRDRYAAKPTSLREPGKLQPLRITAERFEALRAELAAANLRSKNLRTVLRLATAHSESPAETRTKLAMFRYQQHAQAQLNRDARSHSSQSQPVQVRPTHQPASQPAPLPTPLQQVPVHFHDGTTYRLDFYFPEHALAVEYDGESKHRGEFGVLAEHALREGWDRHNRLTAAGIQLVHVGRDADPHWLSQLASELTERQRNLAARSGPLLRGDVGLGQGVPAWSSA